MIKWHPQRYKQKAEKSKTPNSVIENALLIGQNVTNNSNQALPIFTLAHLSKQSRVKADTLDKLVMRQELNLETPNYRVFSIKKRSSKKLSSSDKRYICVPCHELNNVQRFIHEHILVHLKSHNAVVSYNKGSTIYDAALFHCESKWLIKLDLKDFFDSINEVSVYRVFRKTGYSPLLSFQMARLCTRIIPKKEQNISELVNERKKYTLGKYNNKFKGSLPQGAPTSPILSNIVGAKMDKNIELLSTEYNMIYTRYADDLMLSTSDKNMTRASCEKLVYRLYNILKSHGFEPNLAKTKIIPPGARKIVLGLVVNGTKPKLSKSFKSNLLQHLHFCTRVDVGAVKHAKHKKFDSVIGFRNHLKGLISYALQIDSRFGNKTLYQFNIIKWPI
jgi:RNA-directed DNA polymerase